MAHAESNDEYQFKLRSYQQEMVEESMRRNIIVAMDTGSGKSHIAVARARAALETCTENKMVWVLAPTVALCHQHFVLFQKQLPAYQARLLTGQDGVDTWSSQEIWDGVLLNVRVVLSTHAILRDALTHAFVRIESLALIVFDEAHHCVGEHPARKIMATFYFPALNKQVHDDLPAILGLTASPVNSAKITDMDTLERNLDARIVSPKKFRSELLKFVYRTQLVKAAYRPYNVRPANHTPSFMSLHRLDFDYDIQQDPYILSLPKDDESGRRKVLLGRRTQCYKQISTFRCISEKILSELGSYAVDWYITACANRFLTLSENESQHLFSETAKEKAHLAKILGQLHRSLPDINSNIETTGNYSFKVERLVELLEEEWSPKFTGVIFVEQRAVVQTLVRTLSTHPNLAAKFRMRGFVGMSSYGKRKKMIAELAEPKGQDTILDDFREGKLNLLIATSVLEEGIDIPTCHIVICFNKPQNLKSYIQRRGRARQRESKYVLMLEEGDDSTQQTRWAEMEKEMETAYLNDLRAIREAEQREMENENFSRTFETPKGAVLNLDVAVPCLYHFCSTLRTGPFVDLRPQFAFREEPGTDLVTATVTLPTVVDPSLRVARSSTAHRTERIAKRDAAFEAYFALYEAGLVNENLMPLITIPDIIGSEEIEDKASIRSVRPRYNPWKSMASQARDGAAQWYRLEVTLFKKGKSVTSLFLCLPEPLQPPSSFSVYWNKFSEYRVEFKQPLGAYLCTESDRSTAEDITQRLYFPGHSMRMGNRKDFILYFLPSKTVEMSKSEHFWTFGQVEGWNPDDLNRSVNFGEKGESLQLGMVTHQSGERFLFKKFVNGALEPHVDSNDLQVVVTSVPKRKDFLHPIPDSVPDGHQTKERYLSSKECTYGKVPLQYCHFSFLIPSILRRVELALVASKLNSTILAPLGLRNLAVIQTAITHTSACEVEDYERLEFLGDCILKYAVCLQLVAQHPSWPEGYLSQAKDQRVSNAVLEAHSRHIGLDQFIIADIFTGAKWRPHYVENLLKAAEKEQDETIQRSTKILADVVESLIGASYIDGQLPKAIECIRLFLPSWNWMSPKEALKAIYDNVGTADTQLSSLEKLVGYEFNNPNILLEAVTHASFQAYNTATARSYEVLEFLGDPVLDYLVVRRLFAHPKDLSNERMHGIRTAMVNSWILGFLCIQYSVVEPRNDVLISEDGTTTIQTNSVEKHLFDHMRHSSPELAIKQQATRHRYLTMRKDILSALQLASRYPWSKLATFGPEKYFSDLIESVIGAIFVDTQGDFEECDRFLNRLGLWTILERVLEDDVDCLHPKERLGHLAKSEKVQYIKRLEDGKWKCQVRVGGIDKGEEVEGYQRVDVEAKAATLAIKVIEGEEMVKSKSDVMDTSS